MPSPASPSDSRLEYEAQQFRLYALASMRFSFSITIRVRIKSRDVEFSWIVGNACLKIPHWHVAKSQSEVPTAGQAVKHLACLGP
jgi:hypothetical protein